MQQKLVPALLALEDGTLWPGFGFGAIGQTSGEIVFNTSLTGYQEILTDPSYHAQLITMTLPHIGNVGTTPEDDESNRVWAAGLIIRQLSPIVSNWRARQPLPDYLAERGIVAITDVNTRALVRYIRTHGAMRAAISSTTTDSAEVLALARAARDMNGLDLAREVSCAEPYHWAEAQDWWQPGSGDQSSVIGKQLAVGGGRFHVVAYDFGIKRNILRLLAAQGCRVTVVPATFSAAEVMALNPDGIFLSNGPGDPAACTYAIAAVRELLGEKPIFGICLGHQILGLALGAETYKLKFGHRGGNQPVQVTATNEVQISSHNHGFAVDASTLPDNVTVSHLNLNDNCCEGLVAPEHKAYSVQYHPESSPGPHDSDELFARFIELMQADM
ncbi:MAG: glutamine-hydrolyzing carbamoyl-phosphate synthase small subunit [Anaerolineaceae bacterium]|nr:glutamine-hydrolyzing carbamoyl-phosphate synthase small subunit [Anaerolineaceae bacterium]